MRAIPHPAYVVLSHQNRGLHQQESPPLVTMEPDRSYPKNSWMDTKHFMGSVAGATHHVAVQNTAWKEIDYEAIIQNERQPYYCFVQHAWI